MTILKKTIYLDCRCNGLTIRRNENLIDGECKSLRRVETQDGFWKYWCYVDPDSECEDVQDGWSFKACKGIKISYVYNLVNSYKDVHMATPFTTIPVRQLTIF